MDLNRFRNNIPVSTTTPIVNYAYKSQIDGIGTELIQLQQYLYPASAQTPPPPPLSSGSFGIDNDQEELSARPYAPTPNATLTFPESFSAKAKRVVKEADQVSLAIGSIPSLESNDDPQNEAFLEALNQSFSILDHQIEVLDADIQMKKKHLDQALRVRKEISETLRVLQPSTTTTSMVPTTTTTTMKNQPSSSSSSSKRAKRTPVVRNPEDDEDYDEDEDEDVGGGGERRTHISSGACPECDKLRHRDKKTLPNTCPFMMWIKEFGRYVPKKDEANISIAQKNLWPSVRVHFVNELGQYMSHEGYRWYGPPSAKPPSVQ